MTIVRWLRDEFRDFPATMVLGVLWVLVFAAMVADQAQRPGGLTPRQMLYGPFDGHRFGDLTLRDIEAGEVWRTLTATFVHYGLLHIGLNLWALYQLGSLIESWYGSGPFVAIYVLTGGVGNLLSALCRRALHHYPLIHVGGGSTVVMGLVALCAVVGWLARTRIGEHLRSQMIWALVLTGGLGVGLLLAGYPVIDNWGHACGALVGAVIGLAHRAILRHGRRLPARLAGVLATLALAGSAFALVADDRVESRNRLLADAQARQRSAVVDRLIAGLDKVREAYRMGVGQRRIVRGSMVLRQPLRPVYLGPVVPLPSTSGPGLMRLDPDQEFTVSVLSAALKYLNAMTSELDSGANSADFRRAKQLFIRTLYEPPTLEEIREFDDRLSAIADRLRADRVSETPGQALSRVGG